jgi:hypothetical protein
VGFQGAVGGSRPLVAVANATKSKIKGKFQLPQLKSEQLISPCAKVTLLRNVYFALTSIVYLKKQRDRGAPGGSRAKVAPERPAAAALGCRRQRDKKCN